MSIHKVKTYLTYSLLVLFISACASIPDEKVTSRINAWQTETIDDVVKYWGLPTRKYDSNGKLFAEWVNKSTEKGNTSVSVGSGRHSRNSGIAIGMTLFDLGGSEENCRRLITYLENGRIIETHWEGDSKLCYEMTPELAKIKENQENNQ